MRLCQAVVRAWYLALSVQSESGQGSSGKRPSELDIWQHLEVVQYESGQFDSATRPGGTSSKIRFARQVDTRTTSMFSTPRNYKYLTVAVKEADTQLSSVLWALQMCTLPIHYGMWYLHIFFLDSNWEVPVISWDAEQRSCFCIDLSTESYFSKLFAFVKIWQCTSTRAWIARHCQAPFG